jgi:ATP-dependent RNA helicase SUPV3L1/SUV3
VGQLSGFRFTLASGAEGQDLKAVENAAGKALALEFEARAARLHAAGNNDLALSSDGLVRWLGEPVARLTASDHIMRPRVVLLADELLSGHAREHVQARIERFVNHHIATVLKPLDDLTRAEDLQGIAKGLAYQIAENLGVLFRRDVADDVKSLDQEGRASMRKYGIRFGAYHVFMPALLKPAPAELITLLWALKNDALARPGYGDLIPALAAGRTSIVTDNAFERNFYRLAGFRFLGKRAVRIDILERLADLIRPLLQWKPGAPTRPEGAYDGRHFIATPAMLSILGATADDMEEILKGLGYRADSVTAEQAAAYLAATAPAAPAAAPAEATAETAAEEKAVVTEEKAEEPAAAVAVTAPDAETPAEAQAAAAEEAATEEKVETAEVTEPPAETTPNGEPAAEAAAETAAPAAAVDAVPQEEKRVLLWRPGGGKPDNQNRGNQGAGPRRDHGNQNNRDGRRHERQGEGRGEYRQGEGRGQPRDRNENRRDGRPGELRGEARPDNRPPRDNRSRPEEREQGQARGFRPDKGGKPQQPQRFEAKPARKDKPIDPDSPFAKLAILKEQMKK